MLEVAFEGGVGVVDEVEVEGFGGAVEGDGLVDGALGEAGEVGGVAAEEAELGVGVVAAVTDPAAEKEVAAAEKEGVEGRVGGQEGAELAAELGGELLVGVEREDPEAAALINGGVFLGGEALPRLGVDGGVEGAGDLDGAVGGAGVDDDDLVGELDAGEGAPEIGLLVVRDDGNGEEGGGAAGGLGRDGGQGAG